MIQKFSAMIQQSGDKNAAFIEPPFDVFEVFGAKRVKVKATFDGVVYSGSLVNMGGRYMIGMTNEIRNTIGKNFGDIVEVTLERDEESREVELPLDFAELLNRQEKAFETFKHLSYTYQKEYVTWITSAKKEETRKERLSKALQLLEEGKKLKG